METPPVDHSWIAPARLVIASLGGFAILMYWKPPKNTFHGITMMLGALACGMFGAPAITRYWGIQSEEYLAAAAVILGFLGLGIAGRLLLAVEKLDLGGLLARLIGGKA